MVVTLFTDRTSPTAPVGAEKDSDWTVVGKGKGNPRPNEYSSQAAVPAPDVQGPSQEGPDVEADIAPIAREPQEDLEDPSGEGVAHRPTPKLAVAPDLKVL